MLVCLDECRLFRRVQLARDHFRLAVFHAEAVQQSNQSGPGLVSMPHSAAIHAPTARVVRGSVSVIQAFSLSCWSTVSRQVPPRPSPGLRGAGFRGRSSPNPRSRPPDRGGIRSGLCRRPETALPRSTDSSFLAPTATAHSRGGPGGARRNRRGPDQSGRVARTSAESGYIILAALTVDSRRAANRRSFQ
jgi:hypothetical protein